MKINVHAGHNPSGKIGCGAVGLLDESTEDRKVKDLVIAKLKALGHTVYDCTVDNGTSQNDVLSKIVSKCNAHTVDLDVSIHLNSGRNDYVGNGSTGGTEVWVYPNGGADTYAKNVVNEIASLGLRNRGIKYSKDLYSLRKTNAKSILIELCFVDDKDDYLLFNAENMANAIVKGITGKTTTSTTTQSTTSSTTNTSTTSTNKTQTTTTSSKKKFTAHAYYQVIANGKHYSEVCDTTDYAGVENKKITDLALRVDKGTVRYRVHVLGGKWLGWVTGYDWNNNYNGYAGNHKTIDAIQVYYNTPSGYAYKKAKYRVSTTSGTSYLPWVYDDNGYAGTFGKPIDKIQICLVDA